MSQRLPPPRRHSSYHYQTFPTAIAPPSSRGRPPLFLKPASGSSGGNGSGTGSERTDDSSQTPLPKRQLFILAIISLVEQTALNSISPYLPEMAATFPDVDTQRVGLFVGMIASSFAAAQFSTNVFWGRLSDRIGRKLVILFGTLLTCACFVAFGFCKTLKQAIAVQVVMGLANANAGVVSTILGEITDRSNQSSVFSWLPIVYGLGSIVGPVFGGLMVNPFPHPSGPISRVFAQYPYLLPNIVCAALLLADFALSVFMLEESLSTAQDMPPLDHRAKSLFVWLWQFVSSYKPSYLRRGETEDAGDNSSPEPMEFPTLIPDVPEDVNYGDIFVPQVIYIMATYALFNLSNIAFNSLYPIYTSAPRPTGRDLSPKEIGLSLAFAGTVAMVFQAFGFNFVHSKLGNVRCYRLSFFGLVLSLLAMPLVGMKESESKAQIWAELNLALLVKSMSTVSGLTCAMLLITNASPKDSTLGVLNGLAQTLSAGGRAIAPLVAGALFTGSFKKPGGEWLSWSVVGGIALVGAGLGFGIRGKELESAETEGLLSNSGGVEEGD